MVRDLSHPRPRPTPPQVQDRPDVAPLQGWEGSPKLHLLNLAYDLMPQGAWRAGAHCVGCGAGGCACVGRLGVRTQRADAAAHAHTCPPPCLLPYTQTW